MVYMYNNVYITIFQQFQFSIQSNDCTHLINIVYKLMHFQYICALLVRINVANRLSRNY